MSNKTKTIVLFDFVDAADAASKFKTASAVAAKRGKPGLARRLAAAAEAAELAYSQFQWHGRRRPFRVRF